MKATVAGTMAFLALWLAGCITVPMDTASCKHYKVRDCFVTQCGAAALIECDEARR